MLQFWEVADRAISTGPLMKMKEFDLKLFKVATQLVEKYGIIYDPKVPIPSDDDLADRLFEAGVKLYSALGTYCIDTERLIQFTEEEIREALAGNLCRCGTYPQHIQAVQEAAKKLANS